MLFILKVFEKFATYLVIRGHGQKKFKVLRCEIQKQFRYLDRGRMIVIEKFSKMHFRFKMSSTDICYEIFHGIITSVGSAAIVTSTKDDRLDMKNDVNLFHL